MYNTWATNSKTRSPLKPVLRARTNRKSPPRSTIPRQDAAVAPKRRTTLLPTGGKTKTGKMPRPENSTDKRVPLASNACRFSFDRDLRRLLALLLLVAVEVLVRLRVLAQKVASRRNGRVLGRVFFRAELREAHHLGAVCAQEGRGRT